MCGIIGYTGTRKTIDILLDGLSALSYRGYDSAGVATSECGIRLCRAEGKLSNLTQKIQSEATFTGKTGIGHTRWATHGAATETNAHPHTDTKRTVAVVHNGIIENAEEIKQELMAMGVTFASDTDTEVIPHLLAHHMRLCKNPREAIRMTLARLRGAYALGILFSAYPNDIFAVRCRSPLVVARGCEGSLLASDVSALLPYTREVCYPEEGDILRLTPDTIQIYTEDGVRTPTPVHVAWDAGAVHRGGYRHFMEKELHEVPEAVYNTITAYGCDPLVPDHQRLTDSLLAKTDEVCFVGCGSAYHVGLANTMHGEEKSRIRMRAEIASEFRYRRAVLSPHALVVAISQSGETADTLAALEAAKAAGHPTLAVVNVPGSLIARMADYVIYTHAGPEIAVATTKAYCAQMVAIWCFLEHLCRVHNINRQESCLLKNAHVISKLCREILAQRDKIEYLTHGIVNAGDIFFIGRGTDAAICREGALKLKEITYLHAEAYEAGELKHGTISLVTEGTPVIAVVTQGGTADKMHANIREVQARGGVVTVVATAHTPIPEGCRVFRLPPCDEEVAPLLAVLTLDLLAYETCIKMGLEVDTPRNLAKSVTVE